MSLDSFTERIETRRKEWTAALKALRAETARVPAQQQIEYERQLDLVEAKLELAGIKLEQMSKAEDVERDALKASVDGICNEIENALDSASAKL